MSMNLNVPLVVILGQNRANPPQPLLRRRQTRRPRTFKTRLTLRSYTDEEFLHHFRLDKAAVGHLYEEIRSQLDSRSIRSNALPGITKLMAVLHFLASGSFQYCIAGKIGFTQPTFSRCLRQVVDAICSISNKYIIFPYRPEQRATLKQKFYEKYGMPMTIGLIDCTHIPLISPSLDEPSYRNRKMFHSMNVQLICGPSGEILDLVAKYPGGTHDSFILSNSGIGNLFQSGFFGEDILLGDNGYRLATWLITPYLTPRNDAQQRFKNAHRRTRSQVERVFGQLKSRFRCLDVTGGAMLYHPILVGKIVLACAVLHNLALQHHIPVEIALDLCEPIECPPVTGHENSQAGNLKRNELSLLFAR